MNPEELMIERAKAGDLSAVRELLDGDDSLANAHDASGTSAVLLAVYCGQKDVADLLKERGASIDIFEAAALGDAGRLKELLAAQPERARSFSHDGWTPLHLAAFFGREDAAKVLIAAGPDLNALAKNGNANTPLQAAVASRKANLARTLIAAGADVNVRTGYGWTELQIAAHNGDMDTARLLIESSADARARNDKGQTAAAIAAEGGYKELASYLEGEEQKK
jgi:ankyrin repeat protein